MTKAEAAQLVAIAVANFPHLQDKDMGPTATLWGEMLSDISINTAKRLLKYVLATNTHFPTVAELRRAYAELTTNIPPVEAALKEARSWASSQTPGVPSLYEHQWSHPLVKQIAYQMSWELAHGENPSVVAAQFRRAYEEAREQEMRRAQTRIMIDQDERLSLPTGGEMQ